MTNYHTYWFKLIQSEEHSESSNSSPWFYYETKMDERFTYLTFFYNKKKLIFWAPPTSENDESADFTRNYDIQLYTSTMFH